MKKYNYIIIGFGKAGKTLAFDLSKNYQEKVALNNWCGGYIGYEFASMYSDFGSKITLIEISDYFLPKEEEIIVEIIKKHFENKKINFITSAKIIKINSLKWNFN